jgi:hypothetical protein
VDSNLRFGASSMVYVVRSDRFELPTFWFVAINARKISERVWLGTG